MEHDNREGELEKAALALLSVRIGMIMEDHAAEAVMSLPQSRTEQRSRFRRLRRAGSDIVAMALAAEALLRPS